MTQLFHPITNTLARFSIFGGLVLVGILGWIVWVIYTSPTTTEVGVAREQPVQFSHAHHVGAIGIDCRYCHTSVEESSFAGIPATSVCMGCHSVLYKDSPILEPVRASFRTKEPLRWTRVHDVPDFVYFNHAIHVAKGVACVTCHGRVDKMPLMWKDQTLHMQWCLECHRNPEKFVGRREDVFKMDQEPAADMLALLRSRGESAGHDALAAHGALDLHGDHAAHAPEPVRASGAELVEQYHIQKYQLSDCYICHR